MLRLDGVLDIYGPTGRRYGVVKKGGRSFGRLSGLHLKFIYNQNLMK